MPESPEAGQLVAGKYRVLRTLGAGGMGTVYEAVSTTTGKRVAVKRLHWDLLEDRSAVERFVREARVASRVRHPNVVDLYDVDRDDHGPFLVMEYLEGESLAEYLERGRPSLHEVLSLLVGAMAGAAAAHKRGIVHRDIKPENIFLARVTDDGPLVPKVLDFGISKLLDPDTGELKLTKTGALFGTPLYMSYEQLSGVTDLDARADVYSFGVVLYEALTGQHPLGVSSFPQLVARFLTHDPIPLRRARPDLPEALERAVMAALAKDRARRTGSLELLIAGLSPFVSAPLAAPADPRASVIRPRAHEPAAPLRVVPGATPPKQPRQRPNFAHTTGGAVLALPPLVEPEAPVQLHYERRWPIVVGALALALGALALTLSLTSETRSDAGRHPVAAKAQAMVPPLPQVAAPALPASAHETSGSSALPHGARAPAASKPDGGTPRPRTALTGPASRPSRAAPPAAARTEDGAGLPPVGTLRRRIPGMQADQF